MTDEEFRRLATLYSEDAIHETDCEQLNRELANSPDRVTQFNDLRLLAGLIHEHGRSSLKPRKVVNVPVWQAVSRWRRPWMSTAALVVAGVFIGCLATGTLWAFSAATRSIKQFPLEIINGGFESEPTETAFGYPVLPGVWTGDRVEIVGTGEQGIASYDGQQMLRFKQTWGDSAGPKHHRANRWQIVDLRGTDLGDDSATATLRVRFNRIDGGPDTDTHCRIEIHAFEGEPANAEAQLDGKAFLSGSVRRGSIDSDVQTWETMEVSAIVPSAADYLLIGIGVFEDKYNDPPDELEFAGHYVDGVEMMVTKQAPAKQP